MSQQNRVTEEEEIGVASLLKSARSKWGKLRPSLRWITCAVTLGYVPLFGADLGRYIGINGDEMAGAGLAYGMWVTAPCTVVAVVLALYELFHAITGWGE